MRHYFLGILFLITSYAFSQKNDSLQKGAANIPIVSKTKDSTSLKDVVLKGQWEINARSFFMNTINDGALKDDYALASGIGIGLTTKSLYGFQAGISSFVTYNLLSSDLAQSDKLTLMPNRYEIGLFDIQNLNSKNNLIRIENLFLKYSISKSSLTVGKMKLNTPFLNLQDGRMNTTIEEGAWLKINEFKKIQFNGGWFWNVSPRSTTQWFTVANSIGLYPGGVSETGAKSNYFGNISSSGIAIGNVTMNPVKNIKINVWDMLIDNVMNTSLLEINNEFGEKLKYYQGIMFIHQDAINNGGNSDQKKTYINKGAQSNVISAQFGVKNKKINTSINYTHITGDGRYLMPREFGKDPLYTFLPRERNEGYGNVHAFVVKSSITTFNNKFKTGIGYGYFSLPDVTNYKLNKYGMPSYHQINYDATYTFNKFLKGLEMKLLFVYKIKEGETYNNLKYIYNKVNMINFNFILDFKI